MIRIGHSYDIHQLVEGRKLILGGIKIEHTKGLLGVSDADCLLHAIAEALLGSLALGDLGTHFDPNNPLCEGMDSKIILKECYEMVKKENYKINNIDCMIFAQKPKMKDLILPMRKVISEILEIELNQISIKATTFEKLDSIGQEKAIACEAVCLVETI